MCVSLMSQAYVIISHSGRAIPVQVGVKVYTHNIQYIWLIYKCIGWPHILVEGVFRCQLAGVTLWELPRDAGVLLLVVAICIASYGIRPGPMTIFLLFCFCVGPFERTEDLTTKGSVGSGVISDNLMVSGKKEQMQRVWTPRNLKREMISCDDSLWRNPYSLSMAKIWQATSS